MTDQMKNFLIGIFVVAAVSIIIFMLLFLHPYMGDQGQILRIRFADIDKVNIGTRVTFAGKPVGEVIKINELEDAHIRRRVNKGDIYVYELDVAVDSGLTVYNTDKISLRTSGLLGEKSISIDPEPPKSGIEPRVVNKEIIFADQIGSVEDTFEEFKQVADKVDQVLNQVSAALTELKDNNFWENLSKTFENSQEILAAVNKPDDLDNIVTNLNQTSDNIRGVSDKLIAGEGTAGKILVDDSLYLQTSSLLSKGETIMDDMNHYGILFHLDKGWQRVRARRMNLLHKLCTPQEFRNFFNDEMNEVNTSISRVATILDQTEQCGCFTQVIEDKEFSKVFSELLRKVAALEEALQMYNTQLNDPVVKRTELDPCCQCPLPSK